MRTDPVARAPRPPGRRESHWGTLAALGQVSPHWGRLLTCPNAPLPTPMTRCLPQMHCRLPQLYGCLSQCGSSPLHDRTTALQPSSRMPPSPPSPCGPVPASIDVSSSGFVGSGLGRFPSCCCVLALRLLQHRAAQCEVERAESHQWTRAAVAFPASARSLYKPARTERRSLWMSPPSHKALRASTTTAPPNTKSPVPRSSDEQVVTLVDSRPPMRPLAPSPLAPGSQPCPRRTAARHTIDPPRMTRPGEGFLPRAWWCGARGHSAPYPGGTAHDPAMRRAPGGRMPWSPGPAPARGRHLAS